MIRIRLLSVSTALALLLTVGSMLLFGSRLLPDRQR